jgi:hypothetical protein
MYRLEGTIVIFPKMYSATINTEQCHALALSLSLDQKRTNRFGFEAVFTSPSML